MKPIQIETEGGVIHAVHNLPPGIELQFIDSDTEGVDKENIEPSPFDGRPSYIMHFLSEADPASVADAIRVALSGGHAQAAVAAISQQSARLHELQGVLNAIRVVLKFNNQNALSDLRNFLPRIEEVLADPAPDTHHAPRATPDLCDTLRHIAICSHDLLCRMNAEHPGDTIPGHFNLVTEIRDLLQTPVTDCDNCYNCIPKVEAVEFGGKTLCAECAEAEESLS